MTQWIDACATDDIATEDGIRPQAQGGNSTQADPAHRRPKQNNKADLEAARKDAVEGKSGQPIRDAG